MKEFKPLGILLGIILTSLFFFPITLKFFPVANTKLLMAVIGLVIFFFKSVFRRELNIKGEFVTFCTLAMAVSVAGMISTTYNNTTDYAYSRYLFSASVWLSAAYTVFSYIKLIHKKASIYTIINYLTAVCVAQCISMLLIDNIPAFQQKICSIVELNPEFYKQINRLYGIGASLDVAGSRFSAVLIMIMYLLCTSNIKDKWYIYAIYIVTFLFIVITGNMIARTTTVGLILSLAYLAWCTLKQTSEANRRFFKLWRWILGILIIIIPLTIWKYNNDQKFKSNIEFAFEGFFSLADQGEWNVGSNNTLKKMIVFPKNTKTWIIGDGYFSNPMETDPFYTGKQTGGFYMDTDIGYLRFIFYFGTIGLLMFSIFLCFCCYWCTKLYPRHKILFLALLATNFIVWLKVSTDIYLVFAIFLAAAEDQKNETEKERKKLTEC